MDEVIERPRGLSQRHRALEERDAGWDERRRRRRRRRRRGRGGKKEEVQKEEIGDGGSSLGGSWVLHVQPGETTTTTAAVNGWDR